MNLSVLAFSFAFCLIGGVNGEKEYQGNHEQFKQIGEEKFAKQREIDQVWLGKYEAALHGADSKDPEEFLSILKDLHKEYSGTSNSRELKPLLRNVFNLIKMTYNFAYSCNNNNFQENEVLIKIYSKGYSSSVVKYVEYQRANYVRACKNLFLDAIKPDGPSAGTDQSEAFNLANYVTPADPWPTQEPWSKLEKYSIIPGIANYARDRIGKRAHKDVNIKTFFSETIKPVCDSIIDRFSREEDIVELVKNQEDVRKEIGEESMKWLIALRICKVYRIDPQLVQRKCHSDILESHKASKKSKCFGCLRI